jgi:hypothetical protein
VNLDNEVVGIITRKDLAAPIASTKLNLEIQTSKRSMVMKGRQLKPAKKSRRADQGPAGQESGIVYEELRS